MIKCCRRLMYMPPYTEILKMPKVWRNLEDNQGCVQKQMRKVALLSSETFRFLGQPELELTHVMIWFRTVTLLFCSILRRVRERYGESAIDRPSFYSVTDKRVLASVYDEKEEDPEMERERRSW